MGRDEKMTSKCKTSKGELSTAKIIGTTLQVLAIAILIIVDVLRTSEKLGLAGLLLVFATSLVIIGTTLSHLPQEKNKEGRTERCKRNSCS